MKLAEYRHLQFLEKALRIQWRNNMGIEIHMLLDRWPVVKWFFLTFCCTRRFSEFYEKSVLGNIISDCAEYILNLTISRCSNDVLKFYNNCMKIIYWENNHLCLKRTYLHFHSNNNEQRVSSVYEITRFYHNFIYDSWHWTRRSSGRHFNFLR